MVLTSRSKVALLLNVHRRVYSQEILLFYFHLLFTILWANKHLQSNLLFRVDVDDGSLRPATQVRLLLLGLVLEALDERVLHLNNGAEEEGEADLEHIRVLRHVRLVLEQPVDQ